MSIRIPRVDRALRGCASAEIVFTPSASRPSPRTTIAARIRTRGSTLSQERSPPPSLFPPPNRPLRSPPAFFMSASESSAAVDCRPASRSVSRFQGRYSHPVPSPPSPSSPPRLRLDLDPPSFFFFSLAARSARSRCCSRSVLGLRFSLNASTIPSPPSPPPPPPPPRKRQRPLPRRREQTRLPRRRVFRRVRPLRDGPRVALDKLRRRERSRVPPTRRAPGRRLSLFGKPSHPLLATFRRARAVPAVSAVPTAQNRLVTLRGRTLKRAPLGFFPFLGEPLVESFPRVARLPRVVNRRAPRRRRVACARFARSNALAASG